MENKKEATKKKWMRWYVALILFLGMLILFFLWFTKYFS